MRWSRATKPLSALVTGRGPRSVLAIKYATLMISVMGSVLIANGLVTMWRSYEDQKRALSQHQKMQAELAATKIGQFLRELDAQLQWLLMAPWTRSSIEERQIDGLRILRGTPAIDELVLISEDGREQLKLARVASDVVASGIDWSGEPAFKAAAPGRQYIGPVYFQRGSEPFTRMAVAGARRSAGVVVAEVNLKLIWDVVADIRFGDRGIAYVVDATGRLISHPDISLVLRNTDASKLPQVAAALDTRANDTHGLDRPIFDLAGRRVMAASAVIPDSGWIVLAEIPLQEALAPARGFLNFTLATLIAGLAIALMAGLFLARTLTAPIRDLQVGAARIGGGALEHRLEIKSNDELGALSAGFNEMAAQLQASYASLEQKVAERTAELDEANKAKARLLAVASHDLRQPLHALSLFVSQLQSELSPERRQYLADRVAAAATNMNDLFENLLDTSKLDGNTSPPELEPVELRPILRRMEQTFGPAAKAKGLTLDIAQSSAWVTSNGVLLERILQNLISNAIRYTDTGSVAVDFHDDGESLMIEVIDTGVGIATSQLPRIFEEFYRVRQGAEQRPGGLGLGLFIVERLAKSLGHSVQVESGEGVGSRFSLLLVTCAPPPTRTPARISVDPRNFGSGKSALVIDDDPLALEALTGLLETWGFDVVQSNCAGDLRARANDLPQVDLIVTDYHLPDAESGLAAVRRLQSDHPQTAAAPVIIVSGDTGGEVAAAALRERVLLLRKPIMPMTLRAAVSRCLTERTKSGPSIT